MFFIFFLFYFFFKFFFFFYRHTRLEPDTVNVTRSTDFVSPQSPERMNVCCRESNKHFIFTLYIYIFFFYSLFLMKEFESTISFNVTEPDPNPDIVSNLLSRSWHVRVEYPMLIFFYLFCLVIWAICEPYTCSMRNVLGRKISIVFFKSMINIQSNKSHSAYDLIFKGDLMTCTIIQEKNKRI